ncbi:MAG: bifunctional (p)ppGpp synthetase/guanosine-3',5'-bis(diphosphate) 3'-pyrophosphohydrolase [Gemmatimonadetes bacterium]|nr:bifunctional (p)ppGpp synthetase/guanosine-3',5'-bis(diphosphate) 3'-pyrophosphohydrolase [Gemmatimonadota bacterium]
MTETSPTHLSALPNTYLDELVEQGGDELRLSMLLIEVSSCNDQADFELLNRAYYFAKEHHKGQIRKSGEPFIAHCVEVARLLAQLGLDHTTVAAGLLHDVIEDTPATDAEVAEQFGDKIAELIAGVTKIDQITYESREARQAETYRKMLISMVKDIRVMLIKLADRLHNMRTLQYLSPESRERTASETLEVYAPLAHRFGLARIRWQLEDQSLKFLEPKIYQELRESVAMTRQEREDYIKEFKVPIEECLHANGIKAEFTSRAKNFYSIYNKMKARSKPFEEIYDLLAMRIITGTVRECYQILGWVHHMYTPIPGRIKDYISTPKSNMYQSLHTSVIGPKGQYVEVQIRTAQMHHTAEIGIAAHWRYKSNDKDPGDLNQHMSWLHQVIDWQQEATDPVEFMESLKTELASQDEIFVFTPKGHLHQLPKGATPIDFAFAIHTDIGLHCATAKVNDHVVPLSAALSSGQTVEIVTAPQQKPKLAWLDQVKTAKARQAIRRWLREEQYDHNVRLGKEALDRGLRDDPPNLDAVAEEFGFRDAEHLYAALGNGDLSIGKVISRIAPPKPKRRALRPQDRRDIRIQGMQNLMIRFGKCCGPIPGDEIVGLVTRGRGVTVHRTDCPNIGRISAEPDRLLAVEWELEDEPAFTVQLRTRSWDRTYLLADIARAISDAGSNIRDSTTRADGHIAEQDFWIDVADNEQLRQAIDQIEQIEGVLEVQRVDEPASS